MIEALKKVGSAINRLNEIPLMLEKVDESDSDRTYTLLSTEYLPYGGTPEPFGGQLKLDKQKYPSDLDGAVVATCDILFLHISLRVLSEPGEKLTDEARALIRRVYSW